MTIRQTIKRFFEPAMDNKRDFFGSIIVRILRRLYDIGLIVLFQKITQYIGTKDSKGIYNVLTIFLIALLLYHIINYQLTKSVVKLEYSFYQSILKKYLPAFALLDNNSIEKNGTGKNISIIDSGSDSWAQVVMELSMNFTSFLVVFVYALFKISSFGIYFVLAFLIITFGLDLLAVWISNFSMRYRIQKYQLVKEKTRQIVRFIMQKNEILQQNKANLETANILNTIDKYGEFGYKRWQFEHRSFNAPEIGIAIIKISSLYFIGNKVINSELGYDVYLGILLLLSLLGTVTQTAIDTLKSIIKNGHNIKQFWEFFDSTNTVQGYDYGIDFKYKIGNIYLNNVSFGYSENKKIFDDFSINISGSTKTALVGPSGGGKSTLIKLIAGYIRPDGGNIYIDDQDLMNVSLKSYYSHIGYLTQEPSVFDGSIYDNLMYGVGPESDNDKLQMDNIIKLSRCERIYDLPHGLDTEIGERGIRLSGGQRQRLAIAKIMLKNPNIILLDEPTSALDSENEELVTQALNNLFAGKTVIVIAHRLQTVKHADQIIYINNGQVIESGTHEELLNLGGEYSKMVELQSGF